MKPFTVLLIDDESALDLAREATVELEQIAPTKPLWALAHIIRAYEALETKDGREAIGLRVFVAADLRLDDARSVTALYPEGAKWDPQMREELDVLLLDIGGLGDPAPRDRLQSADLPNAAPEDLKELNGDYSGAGFYLKNRPKLLGCQILFLTQYDRASGAPPVLQKHLFQYCGADKDPFTVMHPLTEEGITAVKATTIDLLKSYLSGLSILTNQQAVSFAALHDEPVILIGETGTGKEGLAHDIHRRWARTRVARGRYALEKLIVVNCAGLVSPLAHTELFGHVKGSFTGASDHRLGEVLRACGCRSFAPKWSDPSRHGKDWNDDYREQFVATNADRVANDDPDIVLDLNDPVGTLMLDEFGDLPLEVQTRLLRFLQSGEVSPLGYLGAIYNAKVRLIVATSDPRVASFCGVTVSSRRSVKEQREHPVREDLLFRTKGQVIRVEPITEDNLESRFSRLLRVHSTVEWEDEAKEFVVDAVSSVLASSESRSFGHFRELRRLIRLATAHAEHAHALGHRNRSPTHRVTKLDVERVWSPSNVAAVSVLRDQQRGGGASQDVSCHDGCWTIQDFRDAKAVRKSTKTERLLIILLDHLNEELPRDIALKQLNAWVREENARRAELGKTALSLTTDENFDSLKGRVATAVNKHSTESGVQIEIGALRASTTRPQ